ncbi:MAG TPA: HlyD family efflux transporter periplasmic adaptor subunit [Sediminibacterium sp.]|nr:HlyD family efflux transporter periplasmic adaptor subunit [Sediminibacterium sp.]
MKKYLPLLLSCSLFACRSNDSQFDAQGNFETDETIVSSELPGRLTWFPIQEGAVLQAGDTVAKVDALPLDLQKQQVEASIRALGQKTADVGPAVKLLKDQLSVQETQLNNLRHEQARIERLLKQDAATGKQLDDINYQIEALLRQMNVTRQQIAVQENTVQTQNRSILSEAPSLEKRVAQLDDQINRSVVRNPVAGTVLAKYAEQGEITAAGKALYKIADLSYLNLRAYLTGDQLAQVKLGQTLTVSTDDGKGGYHTYPGTITWISDKAEFTPKTIQTKDERANLVYAIKIRVKNDGLLMIGMYAEVKF